MVKHTICHFEWSSTDLQRTKTFLAGLFDWKFQPMGENYLLFEPPDGPGGGIMKVDKVTPGKSPYIYIEVDEIEPYLEKVKGLGGDVDAPKQEIPNIGWYAHLLDPDNNIVGIFRFGVAWSKEPRIRLGEYDDDFIYDNSTKVVAKIGENEVLDIIGDTIGHFTDRELFLAGEKVGSS